MEREHLPQLAFGTAEAARSESLLDFSEATRRVFPSLRDYDCTKPKEFITRTVVCQINHLGILAATLPNIKTTAIVEGHDRQTFIFHLHGVCEFQVDGKTSFARAQSSAVLIPRDHSWVVHTANPSTVTVSIDSVQLRSTAETMLGPDTNLLSSSYLTVPSELSMNFGEISFHHVFRKLFSQIDHFSGIQGLLNASGLDDVFHRTLILCAMPSRFIRESEKQACTVDHRRLQRVCDYVMSDLAKPISLTDLERFGHMSRRTVHNAFKRRFGMSPMAWVREQRLIKARALLSKPNGDLTVTQVLYTCGFADASMFSAYYLQRFGEHPSSTRARSRSRGGV